MAKRVLGLSLGCLGWAVDDAGGGEQAQPFQPHRWEAGLLLPRFLPRLGPQVPKGKLRLSSDAGEC